MVPAPHVPPGVGHLGHLGAAWSWLRSSPADGEPLWVVPLPPDDLWEDAAPCVDEPVANLGEERGWRWDDGGRFQLFQLQPATQVSGQALHVAEKKKQGAIK